MTRLPLLLLTFFFFALPLPAQDPQLPAIPATVNVQDGDTIVFLGDSITHQRLYTQYVEDFFYQRFPDRRIQFHNAGVGGAQAWDALARLQRDVLQYQPRYVTILLGMNDGRYRPFDAEVFATYQQNMTRLIARIREGGSVPILMSPTMFDARAARLRANPRRPRSEEMLSQYNSVLAYYGRWLQDVAMENGLSYVDMFSLLNDLTAEARKQTPSFTMIRDAVHPDPPGQIVMAYAMIDDMGLRKPLSSIRLNATPKGFRAAATGGNVSEVRQTDDSVEFDWTADALPWVVPAEAAEGVDLLRLGHRASREALEVHGLPPGRYELLIDDTSVGTWPHTTLERHVELQANSKTPQYQQALKVAMLNKDKNEGPVRQLRDAWRTFQAWARLDEQLRQTADNLPPQQKEQLVKRLDQMKKQLEGLEETIQKSEADAKKIEDEIYRVNQPVTRHYVLRKIDS